MYVSSHFSHPPATVGGVGQGQGKFITLVYIISCHTFYLTTLFSHRAVYFEITLYLSSHFSYSCAAFCKIAQAGGGGQVQGKLCCHGVVRYDVIVSAF